MQIAGRRLKIVAGAQGHGLAIDPSKRFTIQREDILEVAGVEVGAYTAAGGPPP